MFNSFNLLSQKKAKKHIKIINALSICCLACSHFWAIRNPKYYVLQTAAEIFLLILYAGLYVKRDNQDIHMKAAYTVCCAEIIYEIISMVSILSGVMAGWLLGISLNDRIMPFCVSCKIIIIMIFFKNNLNKIYSYQLSRNYQWIIILLYLLITIAKMPFYFTDIGEVKTFKAVIITMLISLAGFLTIISYDKQKTDREKERMEADNRRLSAQLHKSREILPAVVSALEEVISDRKSKDNTQAHRLLNEVHSLYDYQLRENQMEDSWLKSFGSTGLHILDVQLMEYLAEAARMKINLDIFVPQPIDAILKEKGINQLRFQRAVGDMIRNSFKAAERANIDEREILVIIGCKKKAVLEVSVMDNGIAFPKEVLKNFGRRGVSKGGTGNGLADLVEFIGEERASLILEESARGETFTKVLTLLFDEENRLEILSS